MDNEKKYRPLSSREERGSAIEDDSLKALEQIAADVAIRWAKTGIGYPTMENAVNKYIDATGANRAIGNDPEAIRLGREAAALRIDIESIHALTKDQEQRLNDALMKIARDGVPRPRRCFRR
ncbi:MAG: hypothetical protein IKR05_08865 [Prevotella sp.]|nr:hypothetical protein [Prevotella sp.]